MFRTYPYKRSFLDFWNARMCKPTDTPLVDNVVVAILKQQGYGHIDYIPRNQYHPDALFESLEHYAPEHSRFVDFQDPKVKAGRDMAYKAFARPKHIAPLKAVRLDSNMGEVYKLLQVRGSKSAGLTAYGMTKREAFPIAMRKVRECLEDNKAPDPCLAGTRTQAGKLGRLVWGYPMMMTLIEGSIARPLLNSFMKYDSTPMAFGKTSSLMGIEMRKAISHNDNYASIDASKFDATIQAGVIRFGFNCLRTWFDLNDEVGFGHTVGSLFDIIENYFIRTPIVMPTAEGPMMYKGKRHGVPSGSYFTQIIDSIASTMLIGTLDHQFKLKVKLDEVHVLGDDVLFFTNKRINLEKYAVVLNEAYGMKVNVKKSQHGKTDEPIPFLGREWINGVPNRSFKNAVERAVSPERYRDYGSDKWRGASSVIASYGFTAMLTNIPGTMSPYQNVTTHKLNKNFSSGLTEFLVESGLITSRINTKLY